MAISSWENRLLELAYEPLRDGRTCSPATVDAQSLEQAYMYCAALTREHSRTFYLASRLLPRLEQRAVWALYAFCRVADDLVDRAVSDPLRHLEAWRLRALCAPPYGDDPVVLAWADTCARYHIPIRYAHQLIDGVARDIQVHRYHTFEALAEYAYGVASTVGLMAMHIIGFVSAEAVPYAVRLGVALQLTNILRDVGEDWRQGRFYLPLDELAAFGLSEEDVASSVAAGRVDERWRAFIHFQIARNRRLYDEAMPGIGLLNASGRFAIAAAAELYRAILDDIEAHDADVFNRRAYVSQWNKLRRLPGIWGRLRAFGNG